MSRSDLEFAARLALYVISQRRREEAEARKKEWAERSEQNLRRWTEFHHRNQESIQKILLNLENLEGQLNGARSAEKRERIEGWISDAHQKKMALVSRNAELEAKIRDVESRLRDAGASSGSRNLSRPFLSTSMKVSTARSGRPTTSTLARPAKNRLSTSRQLSPKRTFTRR